MGLVRVSSYVVDVLFGESVGRKCMSLLLSPRVHSYGLTSQQPPDKHALMAFFGCGEFLWSFSP
jgi:hypothetical protein